MARRSIISFFDWAQYPGVVVVGGSFESEFPGSNVLTLQPQKAARATGTTLSFSIDLLTSRTIGLIHLQNLVTDPTGTIRVVCGSYDSGTVNSWPADGGGAYSQNLHSALGRQRIFIPTVPVAASSVSFTIDGVVAPLYIGFIGVCEIWETPDNLLAGDTITLMDESNLDTVPFGSTYITPRAKRRKIDFALPPLQNADVSATDSFIRGFDLMMINGKSSPVIVVPRPEDSNNLERISIWGTISNDQPFTNRFFGYYDTTFQITQLV